MLCRPHKSSGKPTHVSPYPNTSEEIPARIALYQPDLAPNVGLVIRTGACLGLAVDVIEPCGFAFSMAAVRSHALDYGAQAEVVRHASWQAYQTAPRGRLVALTTKGATNLWNFSFQTGDVLLIGRESVGLPEDVHGVADARVVIPMVSGVRSLNMAVAAAIAAGELVRQLSPANSCNP